MQYKYLLSLCIYDVNNNGLVIGIIVFTSGDCDMFMGSTRIGANKLKKLGKDQTRTKVNAI